MEWESRNESRAQYRGGMTTAIEFYLAPIPNIASHGCHHKEMQGLTGQMSTNEWMGNLYRT